MRTTVVLRDDLVVKARQLSKANEGWPSW